MPFTLSVENQEKSFHGSFSIIILEVFQRALIFYVFFLQETHQPAGSYLSCQGGTFHHTAQQNLQTPKRSICSANWFPKGLCWGVLKQLFSFLQSDSVIIKFGLIVRSCETETVNQDFAIAFQNILHPICFLQGLVQASGATGQKWMLQDPRHWTRLAISGSAASI